MLHYTQLSDISNLEELLHLAQSVKSAPYRDQALGKNKTIGLFFFNSSLRTRLSTQKAANNLGLNVIVMNFNQEGWQLESAEGVIMDGNKAEHVKDAIGVMGRYCDLIGLRSFAKLKDRQHDYSEETLEQFKKYAGVPIISLESAIRHPLQSLADVLTIEEHKKSPRPKVLLTWAPHPKALPQAVANSFLEFMKSANVELSLSHPPGYELAPEFSQGIPLEYNQEKALEGVDFVYAKNWSSYQSYGQILKVDSDWQVNEEKMALSNSAKFMHCLPVRRNVVVSDAVLDSPQSLILEQAENRVYAAQAVIKSILKA